MSGQVFDMGRGIGYLGSQVDDFGTVDVSAGCRSDSQRIEELRGLLNRPWVEGAAFRREVARIVNE